MEIIYIIKVLIRKIWIIITVPLIAGAAAWFFTKDIEKSYRSSAQLSSGITTRNQIQLNENESFNFWESKTQFSNLLETIKSELVISMTSYRLLLHEIQEEPFRYSVKGMNIPDSTEAILNRKIENFELLSVYKEEEKEIIEILKELGYTGWFLGEKLGVERIKDTDYIKVSYASENPFLSSFVANTVSDEFIRYSNFNLRSSSGVSVEFFSNLVQEKKKILDQKISILDDFKSTNQVFNYDLESEKNVALLSGYEIELQEEIKNKTGLEIALRDINRKISEYGQDKSNNSKILELRQKINELQRIYIDTGSKDKDLEASIKNLREQLQIEMSKLSLGQEGDNTVSYDDLVAQKNQINLDLNIANSNISSLRGTISNLRADAAQTSSKESTLESMEKDVEQASEEYLMAVDKLNDVKSKSLIEETPVKILVRAQPNETPESSKSILIILFAIVASGGICVGGIVLFEIFDMRLKTPVKFENLSGLKLSGSINHINLSGSDLVKLFSEESKDKDLETYKHFLRKIRFDIEQSDSKVFLVTSTKQGEGKSFLILSLVYSLSLLNKRILIIDTNFKNNSLTEILLATPNFRKMIEESTKQKLLTSPGMDSDDFKNSIISNTNHINIDIIGSSKVISSPSEIFAGRNFEVMMENLKFSYDYIFMEGPSINDFSDTKELVAFADMILPIFSAKSSLKLIDKESIGYLKSLNGKLMGAVLNNIDTKDIRI